MNATRPAMGDKYFRRRRREVQPQPTHQMRQVVLAPQQSKDGQFPVMVQSRLRRRPCGSVYANAKLEPGCLLPAPRSQWQEDRFRRRRSERPV